MLRFRHLAAGACLTGLAVFGMSPAASAFDSAGQRIVDESGQPGNGNRTHCNGGGSCCDNHPDSDACAAAVNTCVASPTSAECLPP